MDGAQMGPKFGVIPWSLGGIQGSQVAGTKKSARQCYEHGRALGYYEATTY
jgi:hypothetical protein